MSVAIAQPKNSVSPKTGEAYSQFVFRAHKQLLNSVPNPGKRNAIVWDAWEEQHGSALRDRACEYFTADQYQHVERVCIFCEHSLSPKSDDPTARPIVFDFKELARIVDAANDRCETNYYSALVSHHTNPKIKGPSQEPLVMGYTGPYELGMIQSPESKGQIWAIFEDEHHDHRYSRTFDNRRRRSVEVLRPKSGAAPLLDPIATLGADAPRLPLPLAQYSASDDQYDRFYYSMPDFAAAGAGNTFIPGTNDGKDRYQEPEPPQMGMGTQLSPQDIDAIINGLMATPQMQWVTEQMNAGPSLNDPSQNGPNAQQSDGQQPNASTNSQARAMPSQHSVQPAPANRGAPPFQQQTRYSAQNEQEEQVDAELIERYEFELHDSKERYSELEGRYTQLNESSTRNVEQIANLNKEVFALKSIAVDAERAGQIKDLYANYPHMVDVEEELTRCLYSRGANMTADEFAAHRADIERYAKRSASATVMLPSGELPTIDSKSRALVELNDRIVQRYSQESSRGSHRSYDEIAADIKKEMGI